MKTIISDFILILLLALTGLSCQDVSTPLAEPAVELVGPTWQLVAFVEADGDRTAVDYDSIISGYNMTYTVIFTQQPSAKCPPEVEPQGTWCMEVIGYPNEGLFTYDLDPDENQSLTIYFHGKTKMGLLSGSKEPEFFDALQAATSYRINGTQLRIVYGDGEKVLLFETLESEEE